ncbi:hypothetical protein [Undibacterium flavidum]|uniref:Uncharacterized protein n=1 Tax=Undibacterium flavidum TaxID=2762297 RepID=A0ABR6YCR6_9BURK|nr:hypothetical protein [Undibacterium flavidum]MBC3874350.1 hypothetical protein [Undibacterium flavidum]
MKTLYASLAIVTLMISANALAADPDVNTSVTIKGAARIAPVYVSPDEAREIVGRYVLDNGKTLNMTQKQNRYYVEIPGQSLIQLIPISATTFVSSDKSIQLKFTPAMDGRTTQVIARYVEG